MSEENSTKPSYKLYAMEATYDNVLVATKEKYYRITADYILVYSAGEAPENSVEFTDDDSVRLSDSEMQWLFDINVELLQEQIAKETPQIVERLSAYLNQLEKGVTEHGKPNGDAEGSS